MKYGGSLTAFFRLSPYISAPVYGGYTHYAAPSGPLMRSFKAGAGISINLPELFGRKSRVSGNKAAQYPVFPVSFAWYEDNPVAAFSITNNEPNPISAVEVSFFLEQYMNEPTLSARIPCPANQKRPPPLSRVCKILPAGQVGALEAPFRLA